MEEQQHEQPLIKKLKYNREERRCVKYVKGDTYSPIKVTTSNVVTFIKKNERAGRETQL